MNVKQTNVYGNNVYPEDAKDLQEADEALELWEKKAGQRTAAQRRERERLAWLGFYNTATIQWAIGQAAGQNPAWSIQQQADSMLENYRKIWESDEESS